MDAALPPPAKKAFRAPFRRKKRGSPHAAAHTAGPRARAPPGKGPATRALSRRGRRVPALTARATGAALPRPPHGVSVSSALPAQETRLAAPTPARRRATRPHQPSGGSEGPRGPGRSIVAVGAGRALRSFRSPPSGRFATFGGKCPQGTRFPPVPSECIRIARLRRAGGEFAPGAQTFLTPLPAREPSEGGREGSGATPSEKIANGELFRRSAMR